MSKHIHLNYDEEQEWKRMIDEGYRLMKRERRRFIVTWSIIGLFNVIVWGYILNCAWTYLHKIRSLFE